MVNINTKKCKDCAHYDICNNSGYIGQLNELNTMIQAEMSSVTVNLVCEYYKASYSNGITIRQPNVIQLDNKESVVPKSCNCTLPEMTGSTECCKYCKDAVVSMTDINSIEEYNKENKNGRD